MVASQDGMELTRKIRMPGKVNAVVFSGASPDPPLSPLPHNQPLSSARTNQQTNSPPSTRTLYFRVAGRAARRVVWPTDRTTPSPLWRSLQFSWPKPWVAGSSWWFPLPLLHANLFPGLPAPGLPIRYRLTLPSPGLPHLGHISLALAGGSLLATAGDNGNVMLWEPGQGTLLRTCRGHTQAVTSIAFSPGGSLMASGSYDRTVIIWDPRSGNSSATLTEHEVCASLLSSPLAAAPVVQASRTHDRLAIVR